MRLLWLLAALQPLAVSSQAAKTDVVVTRVLRNEIRVCGDIIVALAAVASPPVVSMGYSYTAGTCDGAFRTKVLLGAKKGRRPTAWNGKGDVSIAYTHDSDPAGTNCRLHFCADAPRDISTIMREENKPTSSEMAAVKADLQATVGAMKTKIEAEITGVIATVTMSIPGNPKRRSADKLKCTLDFTGTAAAFKTKLVTQFAKWNSKEFSSIGNMNFEQTGQKADVYFNEESATGDAAATKKTLESMAECSAASCVTTPEVDLRATISTAVTGIKLYTATKAGVKAEIYKKIKEKVVDKLEVTFPNLKDATKFRDANFVDLNTVDAACNEIATGVSCDVGISLNNEQTSCCGNLAALNTFNTALTTAVSTVGTEIATAVQTWLKTTIGDSPSTYSDYLTLPTFDTVNDPVITIETDRTKVKQLQNEYHYVLTWGVTATELPLWRSTHETFKTKIVTAMKSKMKTKLNHASCDTYKPGVFADEEITVEVTSLDKSATIVAKFQANNDKQTTVATVLEANSLNTACYPTVLEVKDVVENAVTAPTSQTEADLVFATGKFEANMGSGTAIDHTGFAAINGAINDNMLFDYKFQLIGACSSSCTTASSMPSESKMLKTAFMQALREERPSATFKDYQFVFDNVFVDSLTTWLSAEVTYTGTFKDVQNMMTDNSKPTSRDTMADKLDALLGASSLLTKIKTNVIAVGATEATNNWAILNRITFKKYLWMRVFVWDETEVKLGPEPNPTTAYKMGTTLDTIMEANDVLSSFQNLISETNTEIAYDKDRSILWTIKGEDTTTTASFRGITGWDPQQTSKHRLVLETVWSVRVPVDTDAVTIPNSDWVLDSFGTCTGVCLALKAKVLYTSAGEFPVCADCGTHTIPKTHDTTNGAPAAHSFDVSTQKVLVNVIRVVDSPTWKTNGAPMVPRSAPTGLLTLNLANYMLIKSKKYYAQVDAITTQVETIYDNEYRCRVGSILPQVSDSKKFEVKCDFQNEAGIEVTAANLGTKRTAYGGDTNLMWGTLKNDITSNTQALTYAFTSQNAAVATPTINLKTWRHAQALVTYKIPYLVADLVGDKETEKKNLIITTLKGKFPLDAKDLEAHTFQWKAKEAGAAGKEKLVLEMRGYKATDSEYATTDTGVADTEMTVVKEQRLEVPFEMEYKLSNSVVKSDFDAGHNPNLKALMAANMKKRNNFNTHKSDIEVTTLDITNVQNANYKFKATGKLKLTANHLTLAVSDGALVIATKLSDFTQTVTTPGVAGKFPPSATDLQGLVQASIKDVTLSAAPHANKLAASSSFITPFTALATLGTPAFSQYIAFSDSVAPQNKEFKLVAKFFISMDYTAEKWTAVDLKAQIAAISAKLTDWVEIAPIEFVKDSSFYNVTIQTYLNRAALWEYKEELDSAVIDDKTADPPLSELQQAFDKALTEKIQAMKDRTEAKDMLVFWSWNTYLVPGTIEVGMQTTLTNCDPVLAAGAFSSADDVFKTALDSKEEPLTIKSTLDVATSKLDTKMTVRRFAGNQVAENKEKSDGLVNVDKVATKYAEKFQAALTAKKADDPKISCDVATKTASAVENYVLPTAAPPQVHEVNVKMTLKITPPVFAEDASDLTKNAQKAQALHIYTNNGAIYATNYIGPDSKVDVSYDDEGQDLLIDLGMSWTDVDKYLGITNARLDQLRRKAKETIPTIFGGKLDKIEVEAKVRSYTLEGTILDMEKSEEDFTELAYALMPKMPAGVLFYSFKKTDSKGQWIFVQKPGDEAAEENTVKDWISSWIEEGSATLTTTETVLGVPPQVQKVAVIALAFALEIPEACPQKQAVYVSFYNSVKKELESKGDVPEADDDLYCSNRRLRKLQADATTSVNIDIQVTVKTDLADAESATGAYEEEAFQQKLTTELQTMVNDKKADIVAAVKEETGVDVVVPDANIAVAVRNANEEPVVITTTTVETTTAAPVTTASTTAAATSEQSTEAGTTTASISTSEANNSSNNSSNNTSTTDGEPDTSSRTILSSGVLVTTIVAALFI